MSYVTSVTIIVGSAGPSFRDALTAERDFGGRGFTTAFREINTYDAGGTKGLQQDIFAAGLNYADRDDLRQWADSLPWPDWDYGVVVVETEGDCPEVWTYGALKDVDEARLLSLIQAANDDGDWAMVWDLEKAMPDIPPKVLRAKLCSMIRRRVIDGCAGMHNCRGDYYTPSSVWWDRPRGEDPRRQP